MAGLTGSRVLQMPRHPRWGGRPRALSRTPVGDRLLQAAAWLAALLVMAVFAWLLADLVARGAGALSWSFLAEAPRNGGREGGILPVLVSTVLILLVCLAAALPLGLGAAVLLAELTPREGGFARAVRGSLDILAGVPSIVFGLFGNAFFALYLGMGLSILSGGLTLACMVLPLLIRTSEAGLRSVPDEYRQAAAALGMTRVRAAWRVLLPAAAPSLGAAIVLSVGRALAETAALVFTSGYVDRMPGSLLDSGRALSVHVLDLALNVAGGEPNAYASALVLVALLLAINLLAAGLTRRLARGPRS